MAVCIITSTVLCPIHGEYINRPECVRFVTLLITNTVWALVRPLNVSTIGAFGYVGVAMHIYFLIYMYVQCVITNRWHFIHFLCNVDICSIQMQSNHVPMAIVHSHRASCDMQDKCMQHQRQRFRNLIVYSTSFGCIIHVSARTRSFILDTSHGWQPIDTRTIIAIISIYGFIYLCIHEQRAHARTHIDVIKIQNKTTLIDRFLMTRAIELN